MAETRRVKSHTVDGNTTTYLTPKEELEAETRTVQTALPKQINFADYFRVGRVVTEDRPGC